MIFLAQCFGNVTKVMKQNSLAITQLHNAIKLIYRFQRVWWIFVAKKQFVFFLIGKSTYAGH